MEIVWCQLDRQIVFSISKFIYHLIIASSLSSYHHFIIYLSFIYHFIIVISALRRETVSGHLMLSNWAWMTSSSSESFQWTRYTSSPDESISSMKVSDGNRRSDLRRWFLAWSSSSSFLGGKNEQLECYYFYIKL